MDLEGEAKSLIIILTISSRVDDHHDFKPHDHQIMTRLDHHPIIQTIIIVLKITVIIVMMIVMIGKIVMVVVMMKMMTKLCGRYDHQLLL